MLRFFEILWSSLKMALEEFRSNKLRTFLSLFGITIGIFCIIGVLATVNSLERNVQNDIATLGTNTLFIDKWDYSGGIPWWKLLKRPTPKLTEMKMIEKMNLSSVKNIAISIQNENGRAEFGGDAVEPVNLFAVTEQYANIQKIDIELGRYLTQSDFDKGSNNVVIGYTVAEKLFVNPERAINKYIRFNGKNALVIGLIKKQGKSMLDFVAFDDCIVMPYNYLKTTMVEEQAHPVIMVQGKDKIPTSLLMDDITGAMRSIRKLSPREKDDFSLNSVEAFSNMITKLFSGVNLGGMAIAALSLIVGMFGVANIMFVTVRERTSQIGLKKAIGAKKGSILTEFLLESAFLCIIGGAIGILLVFILTKVFSAMFNFPIFISPGLLITAVSICIVVGVLAGIIPAFSAARMDPVVAIRSK